MTSPRPVVIGGGPAGLTAAFELGTRTAERPIVLEASGRLGGISTTLEHHGNRIDIGGHRFFSKSNRVMTWWLQRLPLEAAAAATTFQLAYQGQRRELEVPPAPGPDPHEHDRVMLLRERRSRIFWHGRLYDYPLSMSTTTMRNLGLARAVKAGSSYLWAAARPIHDEQTLEDFLINRFGKELYATFFRDYTEKVWGVPCHEISAEWGAQRIKGLSITRAIRHALTPAALRDGDVETSLIERFLYPKFGPGQMWDVVAEEAAQDGADIRLHQRAVGLETRGRRVVAVVAEDTRSGARERIPTDHVFSSMPVPELVHALDVPAPAAVREVADALPFRDFFTVGLLVEELALRRKAGPGLIKDNWIYIQEPGVHIGRLQIFNNWSPWLVADPDRTVWLGLEYFCRDSDPIWHRPDEDLVALGSAELDRLGIIDRRRVRDGCVFRVPKTYPAYFGAYARFGEVRDWLQTFDNLDCVGRNGQHRYNNQDHSMLTAMLAVDRLTGEDPDADIWSVNTEDDYHEEHADPPNTHPRERA